MRILVAEDNHAAAQNLADYLTLVGHDVDFAYHGESALQLLNAHRFDLIILDIMMPVMDGLKACDEIRAGEHAETPIIFVTARDTLDDKLAGFKAGADDYLVKPYAVEELHARIQALEARNQRRMSPTLSFGALTFDFATDLVCVEGKPLLLDPTQKRIVRLLLSRAPALVASQDIAYDIWGEEEVDSSALRTQIYRLRKALPEGMLVTERGKGYRLNAG
ncbi:response regulator transcription factor [Enterovibrio norvegicus]|uniref:response regulator transcription factor n=1 Tax=Enterovibrio norvegicus TaxID=188144 RepID=UPI0010BE8480|nr:response regulator transcription factor [Enterovibrio norvegicus]TKF33344.1 response regulator transcription factor [Enterovibrio norvegicus]